MSPRRAVRGLGGAVRAVAAVVRRPGLWPVAVRQAARLRAPGRIGPAPGYLAFRMVTQYGDAAARLRSDDLVSSLRWCRQWRALER